MLLKHSEIARFIRLYFFLLINFISLSIYSQSETLERYIQEKLQKIDENIHDNRFGIALTKIEELESYKDYISNEDNRVKLQLIKAKVFYQSGEQQRAMDLLLNGFEESNNLNKLELRIEYSRYLGEIFKVAKNYAKSRYYYKTALRDSKDLRDTINILKSYLSIGSSYYSERTNDSAKYYYKKTIEFPSTKMTAELISKAYNNLSVMAFRENDLFLAEQFGNKSLEIVEQERDTIGVAIALINLGNIFYKKKDFKRVIENNKKAYEHVIFLTSEEAIGAKEGVLYNLAYANEELGNFKKAYEYLEKATELTDSLAQANTEQNISEIAAKYDVEREASKTKAAEDATKIAQLRFYGSAFAFLVLLALGYIFYRNYRLKQQSKMEQIENESQTKIINATIDAKEKERKSIAETLHDSVSALLSSANLHLQATKSQLKTDAPQEITKAQVIVNEASVKIRDLSHELISSVLLKFGLAFAVHDMCQKYSNSEITLHSDDNGIKRYNQDFEIKIHNIIEELINNILKHSKASNATIMLASRENNMLSIRISDDGVGFDVKKAKNKDGLGLSHINARIKVMKGVFNIVSSKNNGTSIFISVPIQHKEYAA